MRLSSKSYFFLVALFACSFSTFATEINLLDQHGEPIANAVLSVEIAPNATSSNTPNSASEVAIMDQVAYQFVPKILVLSKGQKVDFPNSDDVRHHVYSFSEPKSFEIKMYQGSDAELISFDNSGIVVLGCNIHDSMVGYIYVSDNENTFSSDAHGKVTIPQHYLNSTSAEQNIRIWHPKLSVAGTTRIQRTISTRSATQTLKLETHVTNNEASLHHEAKPKNTFRNKFNRGM